MKSGDMSEIKYTCDSPRCGKKFTAPRNLTRKYCSIKCKNAAYASRKIDNPRNPEIRKCMDCPIPTRRLRCRSCAAKMKKGMKYAIKPEKQSIPNIPAIIIPPVQKLTVTEIIAIAPDSITLCKVKKPNHETAQESLAERVQRMKRKHMTIGQIHQEIKPPNKIIATLISNIYYGRMGGYV